MHTCILNKNWNVLDTAITTDGHGCFWIECFIFLCIQLPESSSTAATTASFGSSTAASIARAPWRHLHTDSCATATGAIKSSCCVLGVATIVKFNKCKTRRITCNPHISQWSVFAEGILDFILWCRWSQVSDIHFAVQVPFTIAWHFHLSFLYTFYCKKNWKYSLFLNSLLFNKLYW